MHAEIIFHNGQFKGVGTFNKTVTAVAIHDKRILQFGQDKDILALKNLIHK